MYQFSVTACVGFLCLVSLTCAALTRPSELMSLVAVTLQITVIAYVVLNAILDWPNPSQFMLAFAVSSMVFSVIHPMERLWLPTHLLNRTYEYLFGETELSIDHVRHFRSAAHSLFPIYGGMLLGFTLLVIRRVLRRTQQTNMNETDVLNESAGSN